MSNAGASRTFDDARLARIDDWMQQNIDQGRYSGSSVLVAKDGIIKHLSCAGKTSMEDGSPYLRDTIVRIYSMTKMVTTVALMTQLERGKLHLDAPVSEFLPEFSNCTALVKGATRVDQTVAAPTPTLHQLLTHTSGMTYGFNPGLLAEHYAKQGIHFGPNSGGLEVACKRVAQAPLAFQPGSQWEYSVGIDVVGRVLEVILGKSLDAILHDLIFEPLGMTDTAFSVPADKVARYADCFTKTDDNNLYLSDSAKNSEFLKANVETFSGGGGLVSTLDDYFKFGEMVRNYGSFNGARILSPQTMSFMRRNHLPGDIASMGPSSFAEMPMDGMGFGLGGAIVLDPARARMIGSVGDYGWGGMASTFFWTDPVHELTCIFFTQLIPSSSYPNRAELKSLVHGALV